MSEHNISVQAGNSVRLLTAGKYCDRDIVVTAEGSDGGSAGNQLHGTLDGTLESIYSNVSKVIAYACRGITTLTTVNLPEAISIETYAFYGCSGITNLNAPEVKTLGTYAFYNCSNLATINAPNVTSLGNSSFYGCKKLEEAVFPEATTVASSSFYQCTSLKKADFGKATNIYANAFASCTNLDTLILRRTEGVVTLNGSGFSNANVDGYVYVPAALVDSYMANANWTSHASRIRAIEDYPDICGA